MKNLVKIGLIQMHCQPDRAQNIAAAKTRIRKLAKKGAQIICLPELFAGEYFCQTEDKKFFSYAESVPGSLTAELGKIAKETRTVLVTSVYEKTAGASAKTRFPKGYFNTAVVIDADGSLAGKYRKMHIPDDLKNYYGEAHYFEQGNLGFRVFKTAYGKIAPLVCWDQWFPEAARMAASQGAEIIFYPTAIGFQLKNRYGTWMNKAEHEAWQCIQRSHAIANNVFVVAANRVGRDNNLRFWGSSFAADPYGRILKRAPIDREADIIVECDLSLIPQMRSDWPFLDARRIKI